MLELVTVAPLPQTSWTLTPADEAALLALPGPDEADVLCDADRLEQVLALGLHDPALIPSSVHSLLADVAAELDVPMALLNGLLPDVQVLAGAFGVTGWLAEARATPVEWALCADVVRTARPRVVPDLALDPTTSGNPLHVLDGLGAYAGVPVLSTTGHVVGALCVLDVRPRDFGARHLAVLRAAAARAVTLLRQ